MLQAISLLLAFTSLDITCETVKTHYTSSDCCDKMNGVVFKVDRYFAYKSRITGRTRDEINSDKETPIIESQSRLGTKYKTNIYDIPNKVNEWHVFSETFLDEKLHVRVFMLERPNGQVWAVSAWPTSQSYATDVTSVLKRMFAETTVKAQQQMSGKTLDFATRSMIFSSFGITLTTEYNEVIDGTRSINGDAAAASNIYEIVDGDMGAHSAFVENHMVDIPQTILDQTASLLTNGIAFALKVNVSQAITMVDPLYTFLKEGKWLKLVVFGLNYLDKASLILGVPPSALHATPVVQKPALYNMPLPFPWDAEDFATRFADAEKHKADGAQWVSENPLD